MLLAYMYLLFPGGDRLEGNFYKNSKNMGGVYSGEDQVLKPVRILTCPPAHRGGEGSVLCNMCVLILPIRIIV